MGDKNRKVVLGLGNILCHDEGLGVYAVQSLHNQLGSQAKVEWLDGGVMGLDLLPVVEECSHLLVLDAIDAGQPAGTLIELDKDEIPLYHRIKMSEHQLGFQEVLGLAKFRGTLPLELRLVGMQPGDLSLGVGLSASVGACLPQVVERSKGVLDEWGILPG
jgi:hydrogenase maturation protease